MSIITNILRNLVASTDTQHAQSFSARYEGSTKIGQLILLVTH